MLRSMSAPHVVARSFVGISGLSAGKFLSQSLHGGLFCRDFRPCSTPASRTPPLVSSFGRVRSKLGLVHRGSPTREGYRVTRIGGARKMVHRLVARAFLGAPPTVSHCQVNHKDGKRDNNAVENLEYVTRAENITDSWRRRDRRAKAVWKAVLARQLGQEEWSRYPSISEAGAETLVHISCICKCCAGVRKSANGYEFRYAPPITPDILPGEEWKVALHPHHGIPIGRLLTSSHGRVRSQLGIVSFGSLTGSGYRSVACAINQQKHHFYVHRVVARTFLGPCSLPMPWHVNHKDGDPQNNHVFNLEYATPAENVAHKIDMRARKGYSVNGLAKPVWGRSSGAGDWTLFPSRREAAQHFNISYARIAESCGGDGLLHHGQEFRFGDVVHPIQPDVLPGEEWRDMIFDI